MGKRLTCLRILWVSQMCICDVVSAVSGGVQTLPCAHLEAVTLPYVATSAGQGAESTRPNTWFPGSESLSLPAPGTLHWIIANTAEPWGWWIYVHVRAFHGWAWPRPGIPLSPLMPAILVSSWLAFLPFTLFFSSPVPEWQIV